MRTIVWLLLSVVVDLLHIESGLGKTLIVEPSLLELFLLKSSAVNLLTIRLGIRADCANCFIKCS